MNRPLDAVSSHWQPYNWQVASSNSCVAQYYINVQKAIFASMIMGRFLIKEVIFSSGTHLECTQCLVDPFIQSS